MSFADDLAALAEMPPPAKRKPVVSSFAADLAAVETGGASSFAENLEAILEEDFGPVVPEAPGRTIGGTIKDIGITALKGAISVPEAAVGLLDLVTGGRAGQLAESVGFEPGRAKEILEQYYSDPQKRAKLEVAQAEGALQTAIAALSNPSVIAETVIESIP